jgi:hypothetical protein
MGNTGTPGVRFERWVQRLGLLLGPPTMLVLFAVEVSERVSEVRTENQRLERSLEKSDETVGSMRHAAKEIDNLLDRMNQDSKGVE